MSCRFECWLYGHTARKYECHSHVGPLEYSDALSIILIVIDFEKTQSNVYKHASVNEARSGDYNNVVHKG